jgi:hypothetical protein
MSIAINNNNGIIEVSQDGNVPRSYFGTSGKFYPVKLNGSIPNGVNVRSVNNGYLELISETLDNLTQPVYIQAPSNSTSGTGLFFDIIPFGGDIIVDSFGQSGYGIGSLVTVNGSDMEIGGTGSIVMRVINLETNGFLINIGEDNYQSIWENLIIDGTSPTSLSDAANQLAILFSTI